MWIYVISNTKQYTHTHAHEHSNTNMPTGVQTWGRDGGARGEISKITQLFLHRFAPWIWDLLFCGMHTRTHIGVICMECSCCCCVSMLSSQSFCNRHFVYEVHTNPLNDDKKGNWTSFFRLFINRRGREVVGTDKLFYFSGERHKSVMWGREVCKIKSKWMLV